MAFCVTKDLWVTIYASSLDHIKLQGEDATFSAYDPVSSRNLVVEWSVERLQLRTDVAIVATDSW